MRWVIYRSKDGVVDAVWDRDVTNVLDGWDDAVPVAIVEDNMAMLLPCVENPDVHELHFATRGWSASEVLHGAMPGLFGVRVTHLDELEDGSSDPSSDE